MIWSLYRVALVACVSLLLTSCGGGGGGGGASGNNNGTQSPNTNTPNPTTNSSSPLQATFDKGVLTFSAEAPFDIIELSQRVVGTVTASGSGAVTGTLYVLIEVPANSFFTVTEARIDSDDAGHATVQVPSPQEMGSGTFEGTFRVRLCLNSSNCSGNSEIRGSPHTVTVRYTVGDVLDADTVTPRVVLSDTPGYVILRGRGFTAETSVSFGGLAATSVAYVNSTTLRVQHPALPVGSYPVKINAGATTFDGTLVTVARTNYEYAWIPHPLEPWFANAIVYDAERGAFTYAADANGESRIVRYQFSADSWVPAGSVEGGYITQLRMSHDGKSILALRVEQYVPARLLDLDPTTLATTRDTTIAPYVWSFAVANDGNYVFGGRYPGTGGYVLPIVFGSQRRTGLLVDTITFESMETVASGDGSKVVAFANSGRVGIYESAGSAWTSVSSNALAGTWNYPHTASADQAGTRFVSMGVVVNENMQPIGQTPIGTQNSILSADGSRLYVYDQGDHSNGAPTGRLRTYAVDAPTLPPSNTLHPVFAEIGMPIVLANNPNGASTTDYPAAMALTPDGRTVIICGIAGCVVQPTPL